MQEFNTTQIKIRGISFRVGTYKEVLSYVLSRINNKQNFVLLPCSLNDLASIDEKSELQKVYQSVDIATTDGMPIVWYVRQKYKMNVERVYGPDFSKDVLIQTQGNEYRHCLYGTSKENLQILKEKILKFAPKSNIVLSIAPPFRELTKKEEIEYLQSIEKNKINILWIGLSSPKQVALAVKWKNKLLNTNFFCVGAAFDFLSGNKKSPPKIIQRLGLEWLFRLLSEPKRLWKRYIVTIPQFLLKKILTSSD